MKLALLALGAPIAMVGFTAVAQASIIPPGAPTGVSAVGHNQSATVTFTAPTSNGGAIINWYLVTPYINGVAQATTQGTASPIVATRLTNGKAYTFKVKAHNSAGYGSSSAPIVGSIVPVPEAPSAPTAVSAIGGNGVATVSFTPGAANGATITGYTATSNPGNFRGTGTASPIAVAGLSNGTSYTFTVTATNSIGTGAASVASNVVTPATAPDAPTAVSASVANTSSVVSFMPPASNGGSVIASYTVTSSPGNLTATGAASPITVAGLSNGTSYTFTVAATNGIGTGVASVASNAVTPDLPLPSSILDLANWKLTLPTGISPSPTEVNQPMLATFSSTPWFVSNTAGTGVQFRANVEGAATSGTAYPRSELREMNSDGSLASWNSTTGHHVMTVSGSVDAVPPVKKRTVIGQIHDANNDIIEILGDSSISGGTQTAITYRLNGATQATHLIDNYVLGTQFTFTIDVQSDVIMLSANGMLKATIPQVGTGWYFKTGNYTQSNTTFDAAGAYGQTTLYSVSVSHT